MKKKKTKFGISALKENRLFLFFRWRTWYPVIFFSLVVFFPAVYIWWDAFYSAKPSQETINKIEAEKIDFGQIGNKIKGSIDLLKKREEKYLNPPNFSNQREFFISLDKDGNPVVLEAKEETKDVQREVPTESIQ
jgi:hypothetical protein